MNLRDSILLFVALTAVSLSAVEVPVLTSEQGAFLKKSPLERRALFTNEAYRARLVQQDQGQVQWREAVDGETSRWRNLPGVLNMRDIGGLRGLGGRMVVRGKIFRSGGFNKSAKYRLIEDEKNPGKKIRAYYGIGKDSLTDETRRLQIEKFGIKTDLDLRSDGECSGMTGSPLGREVAWIHIPSYPYSNFHSKTGKGAIKRIFAVFLDESNYPIGFHCSQGADRTGSLAYLLEALLGVSDEDLCLDWELTAFYNANPKFAHGKRFDKLVSGFAQYQGATACERAEMYVKELGFTDDDISKFRKIMLDR